MANLKLAPNLTLPLDAVTQRFAFIGRIGSGKTYAETKLAELMLEAGAQVVALDPVGKFYGLRVAGKGPAFDIPVFGGLHGDIPIEPTGGALLADVIVDRTLSCVIDVSQFATDAEKGRFAAAFAERFFFRKKAAPSAVHVMLEECQEFVPQNPAKGEELMLHHWTRMAKLGRNYGIGLSLASQRPQEVNKKVLNLTECMFAFQLRGKHERKAMLDWITEKDSDSAILDELPKLPVGDAIVDSPQWLQTTKRVKVFEKRTADVSATPEVGRATAADKPLTAVDLGKLRDAMAATIERAKADDPKVLRARIATLEKQLAAKGPAVDAAAIQERVTKAIDDARQKWTRELQRIAGDGMKNLHRAIAAIGSSVDRIAVDASNLRLAENGLLTLLDPGFVAAAKASADVSIARRTSPPRREPRVARASSGDGDAALPKGERTCLTAIAQYEEGVERDQLSILSGFKRSTRDAYVQRLIGRGYAQIDERTKAIIATPEGVAALGDFEPLPTGSALFDHWMTRLPEGEAKVLEVIVGAGGDDVDRETIGESTGFKRSTRDAYIQRLKARRLVEPTSAGVHASAILFD